MRRYVNELTSACLQIAPDLEFVAIGAGTGSLPSALTNFPAQSWLPTNLGWCLDGLPRASRRATLDLFHAPAYTTPLWGVHPLVVTIHDVSYERHPEWYPYRSDRVRRWFYRRSARSADFVITDSEFSRKEIEAAYGIGPDRIRVIPLGVGAPFTPAAEPAHPLPPPEERFILHVGDLHPRRNVGVLVDALALLRARPDELRHTVLVLVGADLGSAAAITERAEATGHLRRPAFRERLQRRSGRGFDASCVGVCLSVTLRRLRPPSAGGDGMRRTGHRIISVIHS